MTYEIESKELAAQPVASIRVRCKPAEIGPILHQNLQAVYAFLREKGVEPAGPPFTRYHSFSGSDVDIECGFPVADKLTGEGQIGTGELPGGEVLSTLHIGSYEDLPKAHDAIDRWMKAHGKKSRGPQWESYWSNPDEEPDPSKRKTELIWPID